MSRLGAGHALDRFRGIRQPDKPTPREVANLHSALDALGMKVDHDELAVRKMGASTERAIRKLQHRAGLHETGAMTPETVARVRSELQHHFTVDNKYRTEKLQDMLSRIGIKLDPAEVKGRKFGQTTQNGVRLFQKTARIPQTGLVDDPFVASLRAAVVARRFTSKTQVAALHRKMLHAARIAKLDVKIDPKELKAKRIGPTTVAAITAFREKYHIPPGGAIDPATLDRIESVASSRRARVKALNAPAVEAVKAPKRAMRLNKSGDQVADMQRTLAFLGLRVHRAEFDARVFGPSTRAAVVAYQRRKGLPPTGHVQGATLRALQADVAAANPAAVESLHSYRVRGSVRDNLWKGVHGAKVQVWTVPMDGKGTMLAERPTSADGFFDVPYDLPLDAASRNVPRAFQLQVRVVPDAHDLRPKVLNNPTKIAWVNFTKGDRPYLGISEYDSRMAAVSGALGPLALPDLVENGERHDVTRLALNSGMTQDDVMRLLIAERAARSVGDPALPAPVFYAYLRQNLPSNLPEYLLAGTNEWQTIDALVEKAAAGLIFMDESLRSRAFEAAAAENLIPITVAATKDGIMAAFQALRTRFTLTKPILAGNASLGSLLEIANVPAATHDRVAEAFVKHKGLGEEFWTDALSRPGEFGGAGTLQSLRTTVEIGRVAKNHRPTIEFLREKIDAGGAGPGPNIPQLKSPRDLARLTTDQWFELITVNGGAVPDGTDGATPDERAEVFAATMRTESARAFRTLAFVSTVGRINAPALQNVPAVVKLVDDHPDLDLNRSNLDRFVLDKGLNVPEGVMADARAMQRMNRLAPSVDTGAALLGAQFHSSQQIVSLGRDNFIKSVAGKIEPGVASAIFNNAHLRYATVLARLGQFRGEIFRIGPRAIIDYTYTPEEQKQLLGALPNLETLFGPTDFCDPSHCDSVWGPPAYLADILRFLHAFDSAVPGEKVGQILLSRRPDIGNIKLNCANTETPVPYIDLVCEILENAVPVPGDDPKIDHQTTRTPEELRAYPDHVRPGAYDTLKGVSFPITGVFNLWQEEARVMLAHLGVPRWSLMETLQSRPGGGVQPSPGDASIAAEFFGFSSRDAELIVTAQETSAQQNIIWGFDTTRDSVPVREFLDHAKITYRELLDLVQVEWIHPANPADRVSIHRPVPTSGIAGQTIVKLTPAAFDRIHRFLRLWRRTGRSMRELDQLVRARRVGNGVMDNGLLSALKRCRQVQDRLSLSTDMLVCFYETIDTDRRTEPDNQNRQVPSLYDTIFLNPSVSRLGDSDLDLPLDGTKDLKNYAPILLAALGTNDADLALLLARTNGKLTLESLTLLLDLGNLARGLGLQVRELLVLLELSGPAGGAATVFASPRPHRISSSWPIGSRARVSRLKNSTTS